MSFDAGPQGTRFPLNGAGVAFAADSEVAGALSSLTSCRADCRAAAAESRRPVPRGLARQPEGPAA